VKVARREKVTLREGVNKIDAIGLEKGKAISDACEWILKAGGTATQ